jgi:hypothetical protein
MDTWSIRKNEPKTNPNEPKFKKAKMNVTSIITKGYENISNWAICENEPKTNPISRQLQSPIFTWKLLINRMNRICCLCCFSVPLDSAKMALYKGNWNLNKYGWKKLNLLRCKRLNGPGRMRALTGTIFAHSYLQKFLCTDDKAKGT